MFKKLFSMVNKSLNEVKNMREESTVSICKYESSTNDCDLIRQLKAKQDTKKIVDANIDSHIKQFNPHNLRYTKNFLKNLESCKLRMGYESYGFNLGYDVESLIEHQFIDIYSTARKIEMALDNMSIDEIDCLTSELKAIKQSKIVLEEQKKISKCLKKDISDIKAKLGIE